MASGLYLMDDETIMVDYGNKKIPISRAQKRANGYKPPIEKLIRHTAVSCRVASAHTGKPTTFGFTDSEGSGC